MHVRTQVLNKSPMTITGISASLMQHCSYAGPGGKRRIRDSRIIASANDTVTISKHSTSNRAGHLFCLPTFCLFLHIMCTH